MLNDHVHDAKMLVIDTKSQTEVEGAMSNFHSKWKLSKSKHKTVTNGTAEVFVKKKIFKKEFLTLHYLHKLF